MKIIPQGSKILVLPLPSQEEKVGSIVIPTSVAVADLQKAKVVEVSKELTHKFQPGDIILHPSKAGLGQVYNGEPHLWLRDNLEEIWGVVVEGDK